MISLRGLNDFLLSFLHFSIPVLAFLSAGIRKSGRDASFLSSGRATRSYGGGQTTTRTYVQNGLSPVWGHSFTGSLNDGLNTSTGIKTVGGFIIATFKTITLPIKE